MTRRPLSPGQERVFRAICRHLAGHQVVPTVRELCDALGIGSPNGVVCHLRGLVKKGWLERDAATTARGYRVVGLAEKLAALVATHAAEVGVPLDE